jgi:hypothetical protein
VRDEAGLRGCAARARPQRFLVGVGFPLLVGA